LPIDPKFQKKRKKARKEKGITIWGPVDPPQKLGIRGTYVAVDWDICEGCGTCLEVCPQQVYDWTVTHDHPTSEKKPLPARELTCVQCYKCETECPVQAIRIIFPGPTGWEVAVMYLMLSLIIVGPIYGALLGPHLGLPIPFYIGWIISALALPFFFAPAIYFPKKGKPAEGKSPMDTTVLVDSGIYGIVRHPQILGGILLITASILISQHWLAAIIGVPVSAWLYTWTAKEEKGLTTKFGDDYKRYMQKVPRMNFLLGIARRLRRRNE